MTWSVLKMTPYFKITMGFMICLVSLVSFAYNASTPDAYEPVLFQVAEHSTEFKTKD